MQIEEILIIQNGSESYGISTEDVNQISRVPSLMPLPLRPAGVRGLCAVGGTIVTMVDMNLLLEMDSVDIESEKSRLLSLNGEYASNALLVSEVYNTVEVNQDNIEYIQNEDDPIIAIFKYEDRLVQVMSLEILISKINNVTIPAKTVKSGKKKVEVVREEESNRFLIFSMGMERFALNIEYLREIILADTDYTQIAGSVSELLGLITLRDELIAVVDLREYYGFEQKQNDKNRILIASYEGKRIGLLVDEIIDIKSFVSADVEHMSDGFDKNKIAGVIHDTNDSLISFFDHEMLEKLFTQHEAYIDSEEQHAKEEDSLDVAAEVIVFKLYEKEYAFNVDSVAEIIDAMKITNLAYTDDNVDGIINIRGQVVSIVSLYKMLALKPVQNEDSKIIICNIDGSQVGFMVDSVSDILEIKQEEMRDNEDDDLFTNVLHLENGERLVLSMDIDNIMKNKE